MAEPASESNSSSNEGEGFTFIGSFDDEDEVQKEHPKAKVYKAKGYASIADKLEELDKNGKLTENVIIQVAGGDDKISKSAAKKIDAVAEDEARNVVIYVPEDTDAFKAVERAQSKKYLTNVQLSTSEKNDDNDETLTVTEDQVSDASDFVANNEAYWTRFKQRNDELTEKEKQLDEWYDKLMSGNSGGGGSSSSGSSSDAAAAAAGSSDEPQDSRSKSDDDSSSDSDNLKPSKEQWNDLKSQLNELAQSTGATTGYAVAPASGGAGISAGQSGKKMYTASTIKIPVAMAVQKNLDGDDSVTVAAGDVVGGSGSTSAGDYKVSELLGKMIENSDNTATNALINKLGGFDKVNEIIGKTKVTDTKLDNMMMDGKNSSTITANDAVIILQKIWASSKGKSDILDKDKAQEIIDHMYKQQTRTKLPAKIPDAKVANKTGENTGISHDIGYITNGKFTVAIASINQYSGGDQATIDGYTADAAKIAYDWLSSLSDKK